MNIRIWNVWIHPTRDDMLLVAPVGSPMPIESIHVDNAIKQAAGRGGARIYLEQKGLQS